MTQTEQNKPVRSRDEQIVDLGARIFVGMRNHTDSMCEAQRHIEEAEARGAAEQRRKDEKSERPAAYRWTYGIGGKWRFAEKPPTETSVARKPKFVSPLYTHPAIDAAMDTESP